MQMLSVPIDVQVQGAYTKVGIPLKVRAIALIKLSSDPAVVMNAVERFFIGLAIVGVAGLLVTRGAHGNVRGDQQLRQGTQEILSLQ